MQQLGDMQSDEHVSGRFSNILRFSHFTDDTNYVTCHGEGAVAE